MIKLRSTFTAFLIFLLSQCFAQNVKGLYVNGFNTILGNTSREDSLLLLAKNNGFNYLTLYDVHLVNNSTSLTNTTSAQTFANFISKAKTQYSIAEIGVAAENYDFFRNIIHVYNQQHPNLLQKVDVYNLEFEFWIPSSVTASSYYCTTYLQPNGYSCDTAGAFAFFKKTLKRIDSLANTNGRKSEAYFGFFNTGQGKQIVQTGVDRVLLSIYISSANYSQTYQYNYVNPRLQYLATANTAIKIMPLYSSEPSFMQNWANSNPFFLPYSNLVSSLTAETGTWKSVIQPEGIQWFTYSYLPKKNLTTPIKENEFSANSINIYPNPASNEFIIQTNRPVGRTTIYMTNTLGKLVHTEILLQANSTIDTSELPQGIYFITIVQDGIKTSKKICIE